MNPHIRLFSHTISDGNVSMTIEGGSNFDNSDFPLYLMMGDTTWAMTLDDAIAIARAAKFIARRVLYAHKRGELARAGAVFRRKLQGEGGKPLVVELGLAEVPIIRIYFLIMDFTPHDARGSVALKSPIGMGISGAPWAQNRKRKIFLKSRLK